MVRSAVGVCEGIVAGIADSDAERVAGACQAGSDGGAGGTAITGKVLQLVCLVAAWVGAGDEGVGA